MKLEPNQSNQPNQTSFIWDKIEAEKSYQRPTAREGHSMIFLNDKNRYLIFAGISNTRYSDVFTLNPSIINTYKYKLILNLAEQKWNLEKPTGEIPKDLSHCAYWYDAPYFFFHGGRNKEISLSDTYFLNTDTWVWRKAFTMDQPPPRYNHAAIKTNNKEAYIYGGFDDKKNSCFSDIHKYNYGK